MKKINIMWVMCVIFLLMSFLCTFMDNSAGFIAFFVTSNTWLVGIEVIDQLRGKL